MLGLSGGSWWPLGDLLGSLWDLLRPSWRLLGTSWELLGHLRSPCVVLSSTCRGARAAKIALELRLPMFQSFSKVRLGRVKVECRRASQSCYEAAGGVRGDKIGSKSSPGPPVEAQEWPTTANIGPKTATHMPQDSKSGPRPPTQARQLHDRPSIENIEETIHRQNMQTVNSIHED